MSRSARFIEYGEDYDEGVEKHNKRIHNLKHEHKQHGHKRLKGMRRSWRKFKRENDNGALIKIGMMGANWS